MTRTYHPKPGINMKNEIMNLCSRLEQLLADQLKLGSGSLPADKSDHIVSVISSSFERLSLDKVKLDVYYGKEYVGELVYYEKENGIYISKMVRLDVTGPEHQSIEGLRTIKLSMFMFRISRYTQKHKTILERSVIALS